MHQNDIAILDNFRAQRARREGAEAYKAGNPCLPPARYCDFSYNFVEGWTSAALDAAKLKIAA